MLYLVFCNFSYKRAIIYIKGAIIYIVGQNGLEGVIPPGVKGYPFCVLNIDFQDFSWKRGSSSLWSGYNVGRKGERCFLAGGGRR